MFLKSGSKKRFARNSHFIYLYVHVIRIYNLIYILFMMRVANNCANHNNITIMLAARGKGGKKNDMYRQLNIILLCRHKWGWTGLVGSGLVWSWYVIVKSIQGLMSRIVIGRHWSEQSGWMDVTWSMVSISRIVYTQNGIELMIPIEVQSNTMRYYVEVVVHGHVQGGETDEDKPLRLSCQYGWS